MGKIGWIACFLLGCSGGGGGFFPRHDGGLGDGGGAGDDLAMVSASCSDGMKDGKETDVDCGGGCAPCADGRGCALGGDCQSQVCVNGQCAAPSCSDGFKNGGESDTDCGGDCAACANGRACATAADCQSSFCDQKVCKTQPCQDGVRDGKETDIDCGGGACGPCADGRHCVSNGDCQSLQCVAGSCQPQATCFDGIKNGKESDVDCGGPDCAACPDGSVCNGDVECQDITCSNHLCCPPGGANCDNNTFNGCEVDLGTDANNCGACGHVCPFNMPQCVNGVCNAVQSFSEPFTFNVAPTAAQCTHWNNWRAALNANYTTITISGPSGTATCNGATANQLCHALATGQTVSLACNARTWNVGTCGNGVELSTNSTCICDNPGFSVRPCIGNQNWGGANTATCSAQSQTLTVTCQ